MREVPKQFLGFETEKAWDYENGFYLTSPVSRLSKALAQYELYKSIIGLTGQVVECGVYKGASLIRFATFREVLETSRSRKIIGFDAVGSFPGEGGDEADREFIRDFTSEGGDGISREELADSLSSKGISNVDLFKGDICTLVPEYAAAHPELRIALLHIDVDVYRPTKVILETLFPRIVPGGLLVLDDYGIVSGETRAVDEFFDGRQPIEKLTSTHTPSYIRVR